MFYLLVHKTHFICGCMASDFGMVTGHSDQTTVDVQLFAWSINYVDFRGQIFSNIRAYTSDTSGVQLFVLTFTS